MIQQSSCTHCAVINENYGDQESCHNYKSQMNRHTPRHNSPVKCRRKKIICRVAYLSIQNFLDPRAAYDYQCPQLSIYNSFLIKLKPKPEHFSSLVACTSYTQEQPLVSMLQQGLQYDYCVAHLAALGKLQSLSFLQNHIYQWHHLDSKVCPASSALDPSYRK